MTSDQEATRTVADVLAGGTAIATLMGWLPPIAAGLSIIWLCIQIYDHFYGKKK